MNNYDSITNMLQAEYAIEKACKKFFFKGMIGGYQKIIARQEGREHEYLIMKAELEADYLANSSNWKRDYCKKHFSRFSNTRLYKILMGQALPKENVYYYQSKPF